MLIVSAVKIRLELPGERKIKSSARKGLTETQNPRLSSDDPITHLLTPPLLSALCPYHLIMAAEWQNPSPPTTWSSARPPTAKKSYQGSKMAKEPLPRETLCFLATRK